MSYTANHSVVASNRLGARLWSAIFETRFTKKIFVYLELAYLLVVFFLVNNIGVPYAAIYALDIINLIAVVSALGSCGEVFRRIGYGIVIGVFGLLCAVLLISDVLNMVNPPLIVWAFRNTFRFFGFFVACVILLDLTDVKRILNLFFVFQIVNVVASLYQFFVLGLNQDLLGGIFGSGAGCNGYSNVFFCILLAYYAIFCLSGKEPIWKLIFISISTLALAAMAELKFYYFEFAVIMLIAVLLYCYKVRAFVAATMAVAALAIGLYIISQVFPLAFETIVDFDELFAYSSQGMSAYELSRFGAFGEINDLIFNNDLQKMLLGVGFGGAEYSSNISMFTSEFSLLWGDLNYRWFSHQMWYIEVGAIGFALFVALFVSHAIYSGNLIKRFLQHKAMLQFVVLSTVITVVNLWYNCTIRVEAAYMTFFILAISCIVAKEMTTTLPEKTHEHRH